MSSETTAQGNYVLVCAQGCFCSSFKQVYKLLDVPPTKRWWSRPHSLNLLEFWPIECGTSNAMWLLKLGNKRPCSVSLVHWNTDCWSSEQPCKCSLLGAAPWRCHTERSHEHSRCSSLCVVRQPVSHSSWWHSNLAIRHTSEEASRWLQDPCFIVTLSYRSLLSWIPGHHKAGTGFSVPCLNSHPTEFLEHNKIDV